MKNIIVLGAGMVGSAMCMDLAKQHQVTACDLNTEALSRLKSRNHSIETKTLDVTNEKQLKENLGAFDLVINAVPGFLGHQTLKYIIESGKNVVDISFMPEDILNLNKLAKNNNVTAIVDCGVAPGMGNLILGRYNEEMQVESFECLVGGLPRKRQYPFEYKAPFSPIDVLEEYTRPARYVENSVIVTKPALSDPEIVHFHEVGSLESFNTDGLRSIMFTMSHIPNMKEKTLRYPGHIDKIKVLKEVGFFDTAPIDLNGTQITPLDFTAKLLFKDWKLGDEEEEFTIMRIKVSDKNGQTIQYDLYDEYDHETKTSSMARTTGYAATAAAQMIIDHVFAKKGVFPPELVGKNKTCFDFMVNYLKDRNVIYKKSAY